MSDCTVIYFSNFKEKIRVQKELEREMLRKHGKNKFKLSVLENCVMAEYRSEKAYF